MPGLTTTPTTTILVELDRLGIRTSIKANQVSLRPASRVPAELLEDVCESAAELMTLLADPRRRWREQAEALIAGYPEDDRADLLHLFDEREAIASIDGGQDDQYAGQLAYETLKNHIQERT
jgi:hypothetical protein